MKRSEHGKPEGLTQLKPTVISIGQGQLQDHLESGLDIQCAQCSRAYEALPHWRPHHQARKIVMLKFAIEVKWLKCMKQRRLKKSSVLTVKKLWRPHQNSGSAHSADIG